MSKIKLKAFLENKTEHTQYRIETLGLKQQNRIIYQDHNIMTTICTINDQIHMKRIQKEGALSCQFISSKVTDGCYEIKDMNRIIQVKIHTKKLKIEKNLLEIEYQMTLEENPPQEYIYQLTYEVIS